MNGTSWCWTARPRWLARIFLTIIFELNLYTYVSVCSGSLVGVGIEHGFLNGCVGLIGERHQDLDARKRNWNTRFRLALFALIHITRAVLAGLLLLGVRDVVQRAHRLPVHQRHGELAHDDDARDRDHAQTDDGERDEYARDGPARLQRWPEAGQIEGLGLSGTAAVACSIFSGDRGLLLLYTDMKFVCIRRPR